MADILTSTAAVIVSVAILVTALKGFRRLEASVGSVQFTAEAVNRAVNNVAPDEPTLRQLVQVLGIKLDDHIVDTNKRLDRIEDHITNPGSYK